jgi:ATP-dependent Clp protease ATP-binding subunit ClpB
MARETIDAHRTNDTSGDGVTTIVDLLLADLNKRLTERRARLGLDNKAREWAAEKGDDPVFGARSLKRFLPRQIETTLARALISGEIAEDSKVTFHVKHDERVLEGR